MKLSEEDKELIKLFAVKGMTAKEIALEMDLKYSTIMNYAKEYNIKSSKNSYKHLYRGTVGEVQERLIKFLQESPIKTYTFFNSKESPYPPATIYRKYFGSWTNALKAAGFDPDNMPANPQATKSLYTQKVDKPTTLYLIEFNSAYYKVGITQQTISKRFHNGYPPYEVILQLDGLTLHEAKLLEKTWLNNVKDFKFIPKDFPVEGRGFTECFKYD